MKTLKQVQLVPTHQHSLVCAGADYILNYERAQLRNSGRLADSGEDCEVDPEAVSLRVAVPANRQHFILLVAAQVPGDAGGRNSRGRKRT